MPFWIVAAIVALTVLFLVIMPKPKFENARAASIDDLRFPQAKEGMPGGLGLGTFRVRGANVIWYGDFEAVPIKKKVKTGLFSSKKVIVGYEYYIGLDMSLCLGPATRLKRIWIDKDVIWEGSATVSGTAIEINKPDLFGGKEKGGGFWGTLRFYLGDFNETVNAYLSGVITDPLDVPAYNGWTRVVFEKVCIGESPQLRPISFEVERFTNGLELADATIGDDLNPSELLYQILTLEWGGMGVSPLYIDTASFVESADTLLDESNGMSLLVTSSTAGKNLLEEVLRQTDGNVYQDPETGKLKFELVRADYDVLELPVLDESNIIAVRAYGSTSWTETINQLRVSYNNRANNYEQGMEMAKDMANINAQGRLKTATMNFPGVTSAELANELAHRELAQLCVPLMRCTLELTRMPQELKPGAPVVWSWPEYNIEQVVMRVQKFNMGELLNGKLVIELIQDRFGIGSVVIAPSEGSGWTPIPPRTAEDLDPATWVVREGHYYFLQAAGLAGGLEEDQSTILVAAEAPSGSSSAEVYVSTDGGTNYASAGDHTYAEIGELDGTINDTDNLSTGVIASITVTGVARADLPVLSGGMFVIGTEYFYYETSATVGSDLQLNNCWRALLDSVPEDHADGDMVFFLSGDSIVEEAYDGDEALRVKLLPRTDKSSLDLDDASYKTLTLANRVARPAAPGNIKFDGGTAFLGPADASGSHTITWANRDRTDIELRKIVDTDNSWESGQRTVLRYRKNGGAWTGVVLDPGVATATFNAGAVGTDTVDYELYATRDGLDSFNKWTFSSVAGGVAGSEGEGSSPDAGGADPDDDQDDYEVPPDSLSIVFPFGEIIGTYPIDIPITFDMTIPDNLTGANVDVRTNPADGTKTFTLKQGVSTVGTVAVTTGGVVTLNTGGGAIALAAGDTLSCEPPAVEDSAMAGVTITLAATRDD